MKQRPSDDKKVAAHKNMKVIPEKLSATFLCNGVVWVVDTIIIKFELLDIESCILFIDVKLVNI